MGKLEAKDQETSRDRNTLLVPLVHCTTMGMLKP